MTPMDNDSVFRSIRNVTTRAHVPFQDSLGTAIKWPMRNRANFLVAIFIIYNYVIEHSSYIDSSKTFQKLLYYLYIHRIVSLSAWVV